MINAASDSEPSVNGSGVNGNGAHAAGHTIHEVVAELEDVIKAAQKVQSPLHLGTAARNLLLLAERRLGKEAKDWEVVRCWQWA